MQKSKGHKTKSALAAIGAGTPAAIAQEFS